MPYRHDGQGMGGGPLDPKVAGWLYGFTIGCIVATAINVLAFNGQLNFILPH